MTSEINSRTVERDGIILIIHVIRAISALSIAYRGLCKDR